MAAPKIIMPALSGGVRIAIVGVGISGAYLGARLSHLGVRAIGLEAQGEDNYRSPCAWATSIDGIRGYLRTVDVDIEEYVLREADGVYVDLGGTLHRVPTRRLATFDKPAVILRMAREFEVRRQARVRGASSIDSDVIVDATGVHRAVIGPAERGTDLVLPAYQLTVRYREPWLDEFYVRPFPRYSGYLWQFPLGGGRFFVGAGDLNHDHLRRLSEFLGEHPPDEVISRDGRPIRISPPGILRPMWRLEGERTIVAVGEAAGAVLPVLGEGILPSLESSEALAGHLASGGFSAESYERELIGRFSVFRAAYRFVRRKQEGTCRAADPRCLLDAVRLAAFFSSQRGRTITGVAPGPQHISLALRPFRGRPQRRLYR